MWINNKLCSGGPCVVFNYYVKARDEAKMMIDGLGRYVARIHGTKTASPLFKAQHFKATKGWRYRPSMGTFETPHERQKKANLEKDRKRYALRILKALKEEEEQKNSQAEGSTPLENMYSNAMGFNPGESNEDNVNERREEIEEGETQRTDNQDNTQVNESKENETQTHVSDYVEREEMEVEHEENHNNGEDSLTSGFTNLTEEVEDRQLVELINAKRGDPDLDSIHRPGMP